MKKESPAFRRGECQCIPCAGELAQILAIRPEVLEFALAMERMMQEKSQEGKQNFMRLKLQKCTDTILFGVPSEEAEEYWKGAPIEVLKADLHETMDNLGQALCIDPPEKELLVRLSTELALYCMINAYRANWKCPVCGEGSINSTAVEHKPGCDYCKNKIERMLKKDVF